MSQTVLPVTEETQQQLIDLLQQATEPDSNIQIQIVVSNGNDQSKASKDEPELKLGDIRNA